MITINEVVFLAFLASFLMIVISTLLDYSKKRTLSKYPFISFVMPAYNEEKSIEKTIKGIYDSYDPKNFELIIVNDCSKDKTLEVLKKLSETYKMKIINNSSNLGRANSLNEGFKNSVGEIVIFTDADTVINREGVEDILSRLEDKKVGAASCRYKPPGKGFLSKMQTMECAMSSMLETTYNPISCLTLWGGCMGIKRQAFIDGGMSQSHYIAEDMGLTFKMRAKGWVCKESSVPVYSECPTTLKNWYEQKIRWSSGFVQCVIENFKVFISHPLFLFFVLTYFLFTAFFINSLIHNIIFIQDSYLLYEGLRDAGYSFMGTMGFLKVIEGVKVLEYLGVYLLFPLFSVPYAIVGFGKKNYKSLLWIFPYTIIYFPIYSVIAFEGTLIGVYKYFKLRKGGRGW